MKKEAYRMRIVNLIENTEGTKGCLFEHGLSFYIETASHKLLVDTGASGAFLENAKVLGIDLEMVDTVILSHGHYDHSGGILEFAKMNSSAKIYMQENAVGDYYHKNDTLEKYIGIDKRIAELPQVEFVKGDWELDKELFLFSGVTGRKLWPQGNLELKVQIDGTFIQDDFSHEQYLVVSGEDKKILLSGCAHNGVLNILERYHEIYGDYPDAMISGFHMQKKTEYTKEDIAVMEQTAMELNKTDTAFYTGHCTGEFPYEKMKEIMGDKLVYVHSGEEIRNVK